MKFLKIRKNILLLFVICITLLLSGCENGVEILSNAEKYSQTKKSETINKKSNFETTALTNSDETHFETEFEIDEWTMKDLVDNMFLCGKKITLPCNLCDIKSQFDVSGYYDNLSRETIFILSYDNNEVAIIYCDGDCSNDSDVIINNIAYGLNKPISGLNIMGITESSSSDEVKQILGKPNFIQDEGSTYRYIFTDKKQLMISFTEDEKSIDFYYVCNEE